METFMFLTIAIFFIVLTLTTVASFAFGYTIMESWLEPKPVEESIEPTSEELCLQWLDSLNPDYLEYECIDNQDIKRELVKLSKESDNYLPF